MTTLVLTPASLTAFLVGSDLACKAARQHAAGRRLAMPHGVDTHCAAQLHALVAAGRLPDAEARRALSLLDRMAIDRHDHAPLLHRVWALLAYLPGIEATCVALAEVLGAEVMTLDPLPALPDLSCALHVVRAPDTAPIPVRR